MATNPTIAERADALEEQQMQALGDRIVTKSLLYNLADGDQSLGVGFAVGSGKQLLMGDDPRLPQMPEAPTLLDFFKLRFAPSQAHLLQSANLAQKNGLPEKMVLACLLHDIAVTGFIRSDHGYWGAQLLEPYVDEEVSWAMNHKWYMSARMICVNDLYSFDPEVVVELEQFEDVIGRHFKQPKEGLGNDNSPSSHMWRTLRRPCNAL